MSELDMLFGDSEDKPHSGRVNMKWEPEFVRRVIKLCDHLGIGLTKFIYDAVIEKLQRLSSDEGRIWTEDECIEHFRYQTVDNIMLTTDDIPIEDDGILRLES